MSFNETDIGVGGHVNVTNEDLRNDMTRIAEMMRGVRSDIKELKDSEKVGANDRRADAGRITAIYTGLSILRWAMGLMSVSIIGACVWVFNGVNDTKNMTQDHERRLAAEEQSNKVQDTRLQAVERSQFASTVREK